MRTFGVLLALVGFLAGIRVPSSGYYPSQDSAPRASETAHILMTVCDNSGNSVPAPAKDSVLLHVAGQPAEIDEIRSLQNSPLFFSVLVDVSGSSKQFADQQIAAATKLFRDLSTGDNRGYLILFKSELATNDNFLSVAAVEDILKRFPAQSRSGGTALYDALIHAATDQLASARLPRDSRRAVFVLSDGGDNSSHKRLDETLKVLQVQGVPVFAIGFSRSKGSDSPREMKRDLETLKALSDSTGGWEAFLDEPGNVVARAAGLANGQYLLSFKSPALKPQKSYPLKIESSSKNIRLMVPKEYFVP